VSRGGERLRAPLRPPVHGTAICGMIRSSVYNMESARTN
jgi:hypothetical protein